MKNNRDDLPRRTFIKGLGAAVVGGAMGVPAVGGELRAAQSTSRVVMIRNERAVDGDGTINGEVVQAMMDEAMTSLFGLTSADDCWKLIIQPDDIARTVLYLLSLSDRAHVDQIYIRRKMGKPF